MVKSIHSAQYSILLRLLRQAREQAEITQVKLAKRIGETQTFVSKVERGERRLDAVELRTFCRALGMTFQQFAGKLERAIQAEEPTKRKRVRV